MGSESNGLTWFGNLCYQFNTSAETDDMLIEEPIKYLSEKLMTAGDSFLQFCSDIVDVLEQTTQTLPKEDEIIYSPLHETPNDVNVDHEEILTDSPSDKFLAKEIIHSYDETQVEQTFSKQNKITNSPLHETSNSVNIDHEEILIDSSSDKFLAKETLHSSDETQVVANSEAVNEAEFDDVHVNSSISVHSSERSEKSSDLEGEGYLSKFNLPEDEIILSGSARSTEAIRSSDSDAINHELEPPKALEPDEFLSDSDSDLLSEVVSLDEDSDCDVKEEDNEDTQPIYMQKLSESLILVETDESHSDSDQEETLRPTNNKLLKKRSSKRIDAAEPDEEESETSDEDFSDSEFDWEFV